MGKSLDKNDVQFTVVRVGNGFQATCQCPSIPRKFAHAVFTGEAYTDKKSAEQSAAGVALKALVGIPELVASAAATKEDRAAEKRAKWQEREQAKYAREVQAQVQA